MIALSKRADALAESATMAITAKAKALKAAGQDVIGFGAGEPDFATPEHIVEAAQAACADPAFHHYTGVAGNEELRSAVAAKTNEMTGLDYAPSQVVVTNGAKHAVFNAFAAVLDEGDEVLVPAPYWVTYPDIISWLGGVPVAVPTDETVGFRASVQQLESYCTNRTKALLFVSPSNPTGAVYSPEETRALAEWAAEKGIWVITDDIYGDLVYGESRFSSLVGAVPELAERALVLNGVSKSYAMTGWRLGWMLGPPAAIRQISRLQGHMTSNVSNVSQAAALTALTGPQEPVIKMRLAFDRRRKVMYEGLQAIEGIECCEPEGAFYAFPSVTGLFAREIKGKKLGSSMDVADLLLSEAGVAVVPGEAFGAPGYLRLSYALADDLLEEGLGRIKHLLSRS